MKKTFVSLAAIAALGTVGIFAQTQTADAGAIEFFKCNLTEGKSMDDLVSVGVEFAEVLDEAGVEGYSVAFITPLFSSDISRGAFYWMGSADDAETIGHINDLWNTDMNADVRTHWQEVTDDCENSSLYYSRDVE